MPKTILITGSTDGIGLATAQMLAGQGHHLLLHGRNPKKLEQVKRTLSLLPSTGPIESFLADLSRMADVKAFAEAVAGNHTRVDVLINNAGVFGARKPITDEGLDVRFAVNTVAPYLLTKELHSLLGAKGRVINLSSAAQSPVDPEVLAGRVRLHDDFAAYAQSKLALTMWSRRMGLSLKDKGPIIIAVNPGSMLGSKMVKEAFGRDGKDVRIGAEVLTRAALDEEFESASGQYFDNDSGHFSSPHADAIDEQKCDAVVRTIEAILDERRG